MVFFKETIAALSLVCLCSLPWILQYLNSTVCCKCRSRLCNQKVGHSYLKKHSHCLSPLKITKNGALCGHLGCSKLRLSLDKANKMLFSGLVPCEKTRFVLKKCEAYILTIKINRKLKMMVESRDERQWHN